MTAASATQMTKMGEICAARSKVDSMLGETESNGQETGASGLAASFDRTAMIQLRQARGRWNDISEQTEPVADDPIDEIASGDDEPLEFAVLDLPSFDLSTSIAVRDQAAHDDRRLRLGRMARRVDALRAQLDAEAAEEAAGAIADIDLRDDVETVIDLDVEAHTFVEAEPVQDVVTAIRQLAALRDEGLISTPEFDARMTDLLAQV